MAKAFAFTIVDDTENSTVENTKPVYKKRRAVPLGHEPSSSHFWGDLAHKRIEYVRNFTFTEINTIKMDPWMPYHLHTSVCQLLV